jgi:hypothetical protein
MWVAWGIRVDLQSLLLEVVYGRWAGKVRAVQQGRAALSPEMPCPFAR